MKNLYFLFIALLTTISSFGQLSINEVSYYSAPEFVEIIGPADTGVSGWYLRFYKANGNPITPTSDVSIIWIPETETEVGSGKHLLAVYSELITDNGGYVILFDDNDDEMQFLEYGGAGPATSPGGNTSINIGNPTSPNSIQYGDTGWTCGTPTPGAINSGQSTLPVVKNQIENFAMYPNPVSNGMLYMSSSNNVNKQVAIYAINGQQVYSKNLQFEEKMNISTLNRGIYFVKIEEEGKIATRKLVVN